MIFSGGIKSYGPLQSPTSVLKSADVGYFIALGCSTLIAVFRGVVLPRL